MTGPSTLTRSLRIVCLAAFLAGCGLAATAIYLERTYVHEGRTYVIDAFSFKDQRNITIFELVNGEKQVIGVADERLYNTYSELENADLAKLSGNTLLAATIVQKGEQQGDTRRRTQRALDPLEIDGE